MRRVVTITNKKKVEKIVKHWAEKGSSLETHTYLSDHQATMRTLLTANKTVEIQYVSHIRRQATYVSIGWLY